MDMNAGDTALEPIDLVRWQQLRRAQVLLLKNELDAPDQYGWPGKAEGQTEVEGARLAWGLTILATALMAFGLGFLITKNQTKQHRLTRKRLRENLKTLKHLVTQTESDPALLREIERMENEWLNQPVLPKFEQFSEYEFTSMEAEILQLLASGRSSKEIAVLLDFSMSYIYNIRTGLRKKFKLEESDDLDAWIVERARIVKKKE